MKCVSLAWSPLIGLERALGSLFIDQQIALSRQSRHHLSIELCLNISLQVIVPEAREYSDD